MNPSSIQFYDMLMLAVILVTTFLGARKGVAWQVAALASLIVSAVVAVRFSAALAPYVGSDPQWNPYIAMLILYLGTSLAIWMVFRLVSGIIDRVKLQGLDRQIGGLFGFVKGVLLCLVITFFAVTLSEMARQNILKTYSGHYIAVLLQKGTPLLPEEVRAVLGKYIQELEVKLATDGPPSPDLSPNLSPGAALQGILNRGLAPTAAPAPKSAPLPPRQPATSPPTQRADAMPVSLPQVSQPVVIDSPTPQPPSIPPEAIQPPAYAPPAYAPPISQPPPYAPPATQPPVNPWQPPPPPDYPDEPVPKGMQRVP